MRTCRPDRERRRRAQRRGTWGSSVNRVQLRGCTRFMAKLVPLVVEIMMDHPDNLWGQGTYPVVT